MATGLEIFGVACNVMQTISFAYDVIGVYKTISAGGSVSPEIETHSTELAKATGDLQGHLLQLQIRPLSKDDQDIERVALEVLKAATDLQKELAKYGKHASGSFAMPVLKTVRFMVRTSRIEKLNERLKNYQSIMETKILVKLSGKTDIIQSTLDEGLITVDSQLKDFLIHLQNSQTTLKELVVKTEGIREDILRQGMETRAATKEVVALESDLTRVHISSKLDAHQSSQISRDQRERILSSLKFQSMYARENASPINQSHEGTFQWIFENAVEPNTSLYGVDESETSSRDVTEFDTGSLYTFDAPEPVWSSFVSWLQSDEKFYWISGKPGSGKSSLIRYVVLDSKTTDLLQRRPAAENTKILRAFIWAAGDKFQRSQKGVLATLLHELLSDETMPIDQVTKQHGMKSTIEDWSLKELHDFLENILRHSFTPTCIFIDGLDEIDSREFGGLRGLIKLINSLAQIPNTKFCLGSRPEPLLAIEFAKLPQLRLQDLTQRDLRKHVEESLSEVRERYITEEDLQELVKTILRRSDGVFLWVSLVTRSICNGMISDELGTLLKRVEQLPSDLSDLYRDMWNRMNKDDQQLYQCDSAAYFSLMIQMSEYDSPSLFAMMVSTKPDLRRKFLAGGQKIHEEYLVRELQTFRRQVQIRSAGLLDVPEVRINQPCEQDRITFIHRSAYDFIQDTEEGKQIVQCSKIESRQLRLWAHAAGIVQYSVLLSTNTDHELIEGLQRRLGDLEYLFCDESQTFIRSVVALYETILKRSPWWARALGETPMEYILGQSLLHAYTQPRIQELTVSIPTDEGMLNELFCCQLSILGFESTSAILDHIIPNLQLLLEYGTDVNFQSSLFSLPSMQHDIAIVNLLSYLSVYMWPDGSEEVVFGLLKLLYYIIDIGADLDSRTLVFFGNTANNLKFSTILMSYNTGSKIVVQAEVNIRHLLLYLHSRTIDRLLAVGASAIDHTKLRPLETVSTLDIEVQTIFRRESGRGTSWNLFKNAASVACIFDDIHERFRDLNFDWDECSEVWGSQLDAFSPDHNTSYDEVVQWIIEKEYIPKEAERWVRDHSARELLCRIDYQRLTSIQIEELDWSYQPEYDELLAVLDRDMKSGD